MSQFASKNTYDLVALPGDGIGVEVIAEARAMLDLIAPRLGVTFSVDEIPCGGKYYLDHGSDRDWPEGAEAKCRAADAILLGAVGWSGPDGAPVMMKDGKMAGWSPVIGNRIHLDLYANIRPVRCLPGTKHGISGSVHLGVAARQGRHGDHSREHRRPVLGHRREDSRQGDRPARDHAARVGARDQDRRSSCRARAVAVLPAMARQRVTCIAKHNVLQGCRLFVEVFKDVAKGYPEIEAELAIVDAFSMFVLTQPERYDVCVTTNMFGDIVTDLGSVLAGRHGHGGRLQRRR